jgi:transposase InsO family protein
MSFKKLCGLFGKTRHAFYDRNWRIEELTLEHTIVLELVSIIRAKMPRLGTPKLYHMLKPSIEEHGIKMGRNSLNELLGAHGMLVKRKRRRVRTTQSWNMPRKYPNLLRELEITESEQVWVSDITYISIKAGFIYLSLITDAYSRKIVGYCLSQRLDHHGCLAALNMALASRSKRGQRLIHHSDRGLQYYSYAYTDLLISDGIEISMTEKSDPYENAIAERVNGILKTEFFLEEIFDDFTHASKHLNECIETYNQCRPHASCDYHTPEVAHGLEGPLQKRWKNYYQKQI